MEVLLRALLLAALFLLSAAASRRTFTVDYDRGVFTKDGEPFQMISGAIHYFRIPRASWRDRLLKAYAAGLNTVETYIPWNYHEMEKGEYNFDGERDVGEFIRQAHSIGLLVVVRAGPYVCAEIDMGGLPAWLLHADASIRLRTSDPKYQEPAVRWMKVLLERVVKPQLYTTGGPVIAVQVENEYGFFSCDKDHLTALYEVNRKVLGEHVLLFTVDPPGQLACGSIPHLAFATVDFGVDANSDEAFATQRQVNLDGLQQAAESGRKRKLHEGGKGGPEVNMELYTGWLDHWRAPRSRRSGERFAERFEELLRRNASVNLYMFAGGTNFAYWNGANLEGSSKLSPQPTTYDYDAPLSEAGDTTWKYELMRAAIAKFRTLPDVPVPPNSTKHAYGVVPLHELASLADLTLTDSQFWLSGGRRGSNPTESTYPQSMEQLGIWQGYVLYSTVVKKEAYPAGVLHFDGAVRDRAYVYDGNWNPLGIVDRNVPASHRVPLPLETSAIHVLVENIGRINYGRKFFNEWKGLVKNVTLSLDSGQKPAQDAQSKDYEPDPQSTSDQRRVILRGWTAVQVDVDNVYARLVTQKRPVAAASNVHGRSAQSQSANQRVAAFYGGQFSVTKPHDTFLRIVGGWRKGQLLVNGVNLGRYWPAAGCPQHTLYVPASVLRPGDNQVMLFELFGGSQCLIGSTCTVTSVAQPEIEVSCDAKVHLVPADPVQVLPHAQQSAISGKVVLLCFVFFACYWLANKRRRSELFHLLANCLRKSRNTAKFM